MRLYIGSYFAFFISEKRHWVKIELDQPISLKDILSALGIPEAEVHLVVINDRLSETTDLLVSNEDIVRLYPPVNGG
ncbi:MAG: hypothetical protein Fur0043_12330 [Anaerolineales bacterium]